MQKNRGGVWVRGYKYHTLGPSIVVCVCLTMNYCLTAHVVAQWSPCGLRTLVIKRYVSWQSETLTLFMGSFSAGEEA